MADDDVSDDVGDPAQDPDSENPDDVTTFNPEDPESISDDLGPVLEHPGASPAPAALAALRQATERFPKRRRVSDGIMGDASHQNRKSDHNQGNAFDLTDDPANGCDAHALVEQLKRRGDRRVKYIISKSRIYNPSISSAWRPYSGPNPHTKHAHVSIKAAHRNDTTTWWSESAMTGPREEVTDMPRPTDVTDEVEFRGGLLQLTFDGGIRVHGTAVPFQPFNYMGLPPKDRQGERGFYRIRVDADGQGYTQIATDGSHYHFPI